MMMKNPELHFFKVGQTAICVHASVVVLLAGAAWLAIDCFFPLVESALFIFGILASLLLHAVGHLLGLSFVQIGKKSGAKIRQRKVLIMPYGEKSYFSPGKLSAMSTILVAASGPIASLCIAILLFPSLQYSPLAYALELSSPLEGLFLFNAYLVIVNLFPVAPLDAWRAVERFIENSVDYQERLYNVNQILLTLVFLTGFLLEIPVLSLIALIVYIQCIKLQFRNASLLVAKRYKASDVMTPIENLQRFQHGMSVAEARIVALKSSQQYFPITCHDGSCKGIVKRSVLRSIDIEMASQITVNEIAEIENSTIKEHESVALLLRENSHITYPLLVINSHEQLVGLISNELLMEWIAYHLSEAKEIRLEEIKAATKDKEKNAP